MSCEFFLRNMALSGFPQHPFFMTCKELVDNAVDAINSEEILSTAVEVEINQNCEQVGQLGLTVRDKGHGISPDSLGVLAEVFNSSKADDDSTRGSAGQFGVGLKMVLLQARNDIGDQAALRVCARASSGNLCFDLKYFSEQQRIDWNRVKGVIRTPLTEWTTEVFAPVAGDASSVQCAMQYMSLLVLFRNVGIRVVCNGVPTQVGYGSDGRARRERLDNGLLFAGLRSENSSSTYFGKRGDSFWCTRSSVEQEATDQLQPLTIRLYRFANGMPLLGGGAAACAITQAVVQWASTRGADYGIVGLRAHDPGDGPTDFAVVLQGQGVPGRRWNSGNLGVNVKVAGRVKFTSLAKAVVASGADTTRAVTGALEGVFNNFKTENPHEAHSLREWRWKTIIEVDAPHLAKSMAGIAVRARVEAKQQFASPSPARSGELCIAAELLRDAGNGSQLPSGKRPRVEALPDLGDEHEVADQMLKLLTRYFQVAQHGVSAVSEEPEEEDWVGGWDEESSLCDA